ncbi:MAG: Uma2 family endonuclease [Candidatus Poribacteria bacterium]|nr:Uma2 family endonuclease [Candidatus Poribacteria bacterium]
MDAQEVHQITPDSLPAELPKMTLEEFLESDLEGYEYINGELVYMQPKSLELGGICANVALSLGKYVRDTRIGRIYLPYTAYRIGEFGLIPDISYISTDRLPDDKSKPFYDAPNLAVEAVSPTDMIFEIEEKVLAYLEAGTQLVWILKPRSKTVTVYRSETEITTLTRNDTLSGEEVVKGFSCQVAELFE